MEEETKRSAACTSKHLDRNCQSWSISIVLKPCCYIIWWRLIIQLQQNGGKKGELGDKE